MTSRNQGSTYHEAGMRLIWAGSAMIVLGVALSVIGLLALPAYLGPIGVGAAALAGNGYGLAMRGMRRQANTAFPASTPHRRG